MVHEVGRLVALEGGHELLVVDAERVRRVVVDRRERGTDGDVLVHRALPFLLRQCIPRAHLHERIDDEVRRAARHDLPGTASARVLRCPRRGEVRVRRLQPGGERRRVELCAELLEVEIALGDLPEEEVAVSPNACGRVDVQMVESMKPTLR